MLKFESKFEMFSKLGSSFWICRIVKQYLKVACYSMVNYLWVKYVVSYKEAVIIIFILLSQIQLYYHVLVWFSLRIEC